MSAKLLHPFHLPTDYRLAQLRPQSDIQLNTSATRLMQDFRLHPLLTLPSDTSVDEAQHFLKNSHSSQVMVVDHFQQFCGVATESCLSNQSIMQLVGRGRRREDLRVTDLMKPKEWLTAISFSEIEDVTVGKVISLLRNQGVSMMLVVDDYSREVIGLLSMAELEQVLGLKLDLTHKPSFLDIFEAVKF